MKIILIFICLISFLPEVFASKWTEQCNFVGNSKYSVIIEQNGKYGIKPYLEKAGYPVKYDSIFNCYEYSECDNPVIVVKLNGRYGLVDEKTGREILSPEESPVINFTDTTIFHYEVPLKWTINGKDTYLRSPICCSDTFQYHDYKYVSQAYKMQCYSIHNRYHIQIDYGQYRIGVIKKSGEVLVPVKYTLIKDIMFDYGYSIVEIDEKQGLIDSTGKEVIPCIYDFIIIPEKRTVIMPNGITYDPPLIWPIVAQKEGKIGLIDSMGKEVVPFIYDNIRINHHTCAWPTIAQKEGKYGVIDSLGQEVIPFDYEKIRHIIYWKGGKCEKSFFLTENSLFDINGNRMIEPGKYDELYISFTDIHTQFPWSWKYAVLYTRMKDKWGIIKCRRNFCNSTCI